MVLLFLFLETMMTVFAGVKLPLLLQRIDGHSIAVGTFPGGGLQRL
jgi:hypothetical protein